MSIAPFVVAQSIPMPGSGTTSTAGGPGGITVGGGTLLRSPQWVTPSTPKA